MAAARSAHGHCLGAVGHSDEGEQKLLAALTITEAALGPEHPRVGGGVRNRLAQLYDA